MNDAIIYDPETNTYYELKDYNQYCDGVLRPAEKTTVPGEILWRHVIKEDGSGSYWFYIKGEAITGRTNLMWSGMNDAIIYDPETNTYYELKDYKRHSDGVLRLATLTKFP